MKNEKGCPVIGDDGIVRGDLSKLLKCLPDKSVDIVVTDPPYGTNYSTGYRKKTFIKGSSSIACDTSECIVPKLESMMDEIDRVLKDDSHV